MKEYRLRHKAKNEFLKVRLSSNEGGDFCGEFQYILEVDNDNINCWMSMTPEHAEWVRHNSTEWYNADYATPTHYYKADELEIVEVEIIMDAKPIDVKIPTHIEMFRYKQEKYPREFQFYENCIKEFIKDCEKKEIDPDQVSCRDYYSLSEYLWKRDNPPKPKRTRKKKDGQS